MLKEINIKRKRCKYIRINIKNGEVEVIAPYGSSLKTINDFIISKSDWINKTVNKQKTTIHRTKENEKYIYYKGNIIDTDITAEKAYKNFYLSKLSYLSVRTKELSEKFGYKFKGLNFSNAKTLWGTCDRFDNIRLNWRLLAIPVRLSDYVILHELVHIIHHNHSRDFWAELEKNIPDCKQLKKELKEYSWILNAYR